MTFIEDNVSELINELLETEVVIVRDDDGWNFFTFNGTKTISEFESDLNSAYHHAIKDISSVLSCLEIDPKNYIEGIIMRIDDILEEFITSDNLLLKKNLSISNLRDLETSPEMVTPKCKQTISDFITLQKEITLKFLKKLKKFLPSAVPEKITWNKNKTDLVELSNALSCDKSLVRDGVPLTKKECINYFATLFGVEIKNPHKDASKLFDRENPALFLEHLAKLLRKGQSKRDCYLDS